MVSTNYKSLAYEYEHAIREEPNISRWNLQRCKKKRHRHSNAILKQGTP